MVRGEFMQAAKMALLNLDSGIPKYFLTCRKAGVPRGQPRAPVTDDAVLNCPDGWRNIAGLFW
jgi:hypothetical protein